MSEETYKLNEAGREALILWINHVPPSNAPKHVQKSLRWLYGDFEAVGVGIGLMLHIRTAECKTPQQLRQRALEAIDKLNEFATSGNPPALVVERYKAWASTYTVAA